MSLEMKGRELSMDDLDQVNGGLGNAPYIMRIACQYDDCKKIFPIDIRKNSVMCPYCKRPNTFSG